MTDNRMSLFCLVDGESTSSVFPVKLSADDSIGDLKKLIKSEKSPEFDDIPADKLTLWHVSIPVDPANKHKPIVLNEFESATELDPTDDISDVFEETPPKKTVHIIVQRPLQAPKRDREDYTTNAGLLEMDLKAELEKVPDKAVVRYFDMSEMSNPEYDTQDVLEAFSRFVSFRIFHKEFSSNELAVKLQALPRLPRFYILVDEFQAIFRSKKLLQAAKNFFRGLSNKMSVSYVCVGTFKLTKLLYYDGTMESPFNKAAFARMPPFDVQEMGRLFDMYKENCNPAGISQPIQGKVIHESGGHPASFMILLKLVLLHQPNMGNWAGLLQENIGRLMNGSQTKIRIFLESLTIKEKALVRDLTKYQMNCWEFVSSDLNRYLLNVGILDSSDEKNARFTSGIILRACIDALWPRPDNRLSKEDVGDPINILRLGLQCISPSTVASPLVQNKFGPQENSFQVALFSALNGLLPTTMKCLFEAKAKDDEHLDLMVAEGVINWAGYELKVNKISASDFKASLVQASKYAKFYGIPIYLISFYLEGHTTPATPLHVPADVVVVNIMHSKDCTRFLITAPDGNKITVNTNQSDTLS
ncbi:hypothetical protein CPC16_004499 [Podila verticillata]|nr:hypothetical protein CPC16_004499 [Podila verticillata]